MVLVLVQVHVQWTHMEEVEYAEVDFHPHCHHINKKKLEYEYKMAQMTKMARRLKKEKILN
jgi:hypothetical protein